MYWTSLLGSLETWRWLLSSLVTFSSNCWEMACQTGGTTDLYFQCSRLLHVLKQVPCYLLLFLYPCFYRCIVNPTSNTGAANSPWFCKEWQVPLNRSATVSQTGEGEGRVRKFLKFLSEAEGSWAKLREAEGSWGRLREAEGSWANLYEAEMTYI